MTEVNARILYWGAPGAGKLANLKMIHSKLRPDHRGEIENHPTRIDPSVSYHALPIELGNVGGLRTRIRIETTPSSPEHEPTRRQLLDRVDGVVFVVDTHRDQIDATLASWAELREMLAEYGREVSDVPLVVQYNKRDLSDPFALEELHRKLELTGVAAFEAVATEGTGILQTLTTISKRVVRTLRERGPERPTEAESADVAEPLADSEPQLDPLPTEGLDAELLAPDDENEADLEAIEATTTLAESAFEETFREATSDATAEAFDMDFATSLDTPDESSSETAPDGSFEIVQVGTARADGPRGVAVPLVLRDERGEERSLVLSVRLDPMEEA
ncbi:MAG: hypothetical protein JRH01_17310 [Deltaproteobacteria bacterium]|nr:hypothetical protein [Deltaproteobacteria bacterium]